MCVGPLAGRGGGRIRFFFLFSGKSGEVFPFFFSCPKTFFDDSGGPKVTIQKKNLIRFFDSCPFFLFLSGFPPKHRPDEPWAFPPPSPTCFWEGLFLSSFPYFSFFLGDPLFSPGCFRVLFLLSPTPTLSFALISFEAEKNSGPRFVTIHFHNCTLPPPPPHTPGHLLSLVEPGPDGPPPTHCKPSHGFLRLDYGCTEGSSGSAQPNPPMLRRESGPFFLRAAPNISPF